MGSLAGYIPVSFLGKMPGFHLSRPLAFLPGVVLTPGCVLLLGFILDRILGDPVGWPHPVIWLGRAAAWGEKRLNRGTARARKRKGILLAVLLIGGTYGLTWGLLKLAALIHPLVGLALQVCLIASALAGKSLLEAGKSVYLPLKMGDLPQARRTLAGFVSRDTSRLSEGEVVRATVETLAENFVDGILSPLLFAAVGGAPLAWAFKAVSTLDSMVGYRNERYRSFGWFSARADDWANFLPARLSVPLFLLAGSGQGLDVRSALRIWRRDAKSHPSPNGGNPESVTAGLLGIQLGGMNIYQGELSHRAEMGDALRPLQSADIRTTLALVRLAAWLSLLPALVLALVL
ncbi:threonine-phosphate decarboxylase [Acididesulfobacillus acetoxydans]|uniref:Cobalamin biosynthesis protein CobD n=1 Tax=Acididesulfobacillus acetoxydans TaxID=1561005 RepID=A0A8S0X5T4_9FIRM|nr:adenosylcobinamide-phosphate synthase CbiB [Acididesulfobacillus acetoxydans]CAA7601910.1 threonine-phosphate decarboxylase [Acididesulfobacillus acetoxydans]CEJ08246.1 Cobalamin biosynthesis protein CobD [Acididesulfobacillus acetoxydans]